jgi:hypothetical protein
MQPILVCLKDEEEFSFWHTYKELIFMIEYRKLHLKSGFWKKELWRSIPYNIRKHIIPTEFILKGDIVSVSENFNKNETTGLFENTGLMINGLVTTLKTRPNYFGNFMILKDLIQNSDVKPEFYIDKSDLDKWIYLKGPKKKCGQCTVLNTITVKVEWFFPTHWTNLQEQL